MTPNPIRLASNRDVARAVRAITSGAKFIGNSMSGEPNPWVTHPTKRMPSLPSPYGHRMPDDALQTMTELAQSPGIDYVIFSWVTPIAYRLTDGSWVIPDVTYSGFTSRHMGLVWQALSRMGINTHVERPITYGPRGGKHYGRRNERFYPYTMSTSNAE